MDQKKVFLRTLKMRLKCSLANGQAGVDAWEDKTKSAFCFWELRTLSHISEELKTRATNSRQKHRKV